MRLSRILATLVACGCLFTAVGSAQAYPSKPITVVVPFGAGGALDLIARVLADGLRNELGQPVIVDNKPARAVARHAGGRRIWRGMAAPVTFIEARAITSCCRCLTASFSLDVLHGVLSTISLSGQFQHTLHREKRAACCLGEGAGELSVRPNPAKLSFGSSGVGAPNFILPAST